MPETRIIQLTLTEDELLVAIAYNSLAVAMATNDNEMIRLCSQQVYAMQHLRGKAAFSLDTKLKLAVKSALTEWKIIESY